MASTVTYRGPASPTDRTKAYQVEDYMFRRGVPVEDVPEKVAKQVAADKDHLFDVTKTTTGGAS